MNREYALINKMIDHVIMRPDTSTYSKHFAILLNILIEIMVTPAFATYHTLCETLFYNNYSYLNTLLQGDNIVGGEEDYEIMRKVISLIKEEILDKCGDIDNKKIVEKLIISYYD